MYFVDYGSSTFVKLENLRHLDSEFVGFMPKQAIECRLKGLWSEDDDENFTKEFKDWVWALIEKQNKFEIKNLAYLHDTKAYVINLIHCKTGYSLLAELDKYEKTRNFPNPGYQIPIIPANGIMHLRDIGNLEDFQNTINDLTINPAVNLEGE